MPIIKKKIMPKNKTLLLQIEKEILNWVGEGKTNKEIAHRTTKTKQGINSHIKNIMKKLDCESKKQAYSKAVSLKLISPYKPLSMADKTHSKQKILIVGLGRGGTAMLEILKENPLIKVVGAVDINQRARGVTVAKKLNIPVFSDFRQVINKGVDIIVNVTGSKDVMSELASLKPNKTELMDGFSARLLCQLVAEKRTRIKERERVLKEHEALYHLGLVIENIDSMHDAGLAILDYATKLTATPAGSIALFDEKSGEMVLIASKGFSHNFKKVTRWSVRKGGLTSHVLNQKSPLVIPDIREYPDSNLLLLNEGIISLLGVPLTMEGKIIGVLYVNDFKKREFRAEDISIFSLLSVYVALTIERVKSIEEMRHLSITDGLTGLYNHRYLMEQMRKEIQRAKRHGHPLSIIMLDIDYFKKYNDNFGHLEGNKAIKCIARILKREVRDIDTVGRFGGEEFCIIVHEVRKDEAVVFAKRLLREIANNSFSGRKITLSGGVSVFPKNGKTPAELIKKADEALYDAKKQGRNRICC